MIKGSKISGTLNYISDYSSAFGPGLDSGNYLVIHAEVPGVEDAVITVKINNVSTLDPDGLAVMRIADKDSQTLTVVASKEGYRSVTKVFDLRGLNCLSE